jgi:hypothetical protein
MHRPVAWLALACALGCAPRAVPLEPAQQAHAAGRAHVGDFSFAPPAGRWIVEPLAKGASFDALARGLPKRWGDFLASVAPPAEDGLRLCRLSRVRWVNAEGDSTNPREDCASFVPVALASGESAGASARALADRIASQARAIEDDFLGEPDFWRGVKWVRARGDASVLRVGSLELTDLHWVARDDGRTLRGGGRALLLPGALGRALAIVVADAGLVARDGELWRVIASLESTAR